MIRTALRLALRAVVVSGCLFVAGSAFAASEWAIGSVVGGARAARLSVSVEGADAPHDRLYPGGRADVSLMIRNPNPYPIEITGIALPSSATFAQGFSAPSLLVRRSGCGTIDSRVVWQYALAARVSQHRLARPLVVAPQSERTVVLVDAASMARSAPAMCEGAFFAMPSLKGVTVAAARRSGPSTQTTDAIEPSPLPLRPQATSRPATPRTGGDDRPRAHRCARGGARG
jgi:hypothetical protein